MFDDIAPVLRTFFLPQLEQTGVRARPVGFGYLGHASGSLSTGTIWAGALGNDCLVTSHEIRVHDSLHIVEEPGSDYLCICSISAASVSCCSAGRRPRRVRPTENVLVFMQPAGPVPFNMHPGLSYACTSVCLLPSYFERLARELPGNLDGLVAEASACAPEELPASLRSIMRSLGAQAPGLHGSAGATPVVPAVPRSALFYRAKVMELTAELLEMVSARRRAREQDGEATQRRLARQACDLIDASLPGQPPTIEAMARELCVGRSQLCAAFRQEMGVSIGAYARGRRMEEARELLTTTELPIAEVGRRVGYACAGSFTEAFEAATGMSPSAWRARER